MATEIVLYTGRNQLQSNLETQPVRFTWDVTESPANTWVYTFYFYDIHNEPCKDMAYTAWVANSLKGTLEPTGLSILTDTLYGDRLFSPTAGVNIFRTDDNGASGIQVTLTSGTKYLNLIMPNGKVIGINNVMVF